MITGDQYRERIAKLKPNVYMGGKVVDRFDPKLVGGVNVIAATYDLAADPELESVGTATSHLTGEKINRFCHIHQNTEDLLKKQKMTRLYCQEVGGCIQRCMGIDALNALSVVTYEADQKRFKSEDRQLCTKQVQHDEVIYEPSKCIKCGICVRLTAKHQEEYGFTFIGRGFDVVVGIPFNENTAAGLKKVALVVADACPTGAISRK